MIDSAIMDSLDTPFTLSVTGLICVKGMGQRYEQQKRAPAFTKLLAPELPSLAPELPSLQLFPPLLTSSLHLQRWFQMLLGPEILYFGFYIVRVGAKLDLD